MQGKTAVVPKSLGAQVSPAQRGPDPLPDSWGDWLVQNAKGRVRVIGGLEQNESENHFLGSVAQSPGTSVGAEMWSCSDDFELAATLVARARDIRERMSKHIREGTIDLDSKSLTSEGKTVYNNVKTLQSESVARKEALEEKYLTGAPSAVIEEISTVERQCNLLKREVEQWEATVPPPPVPNSRRPNVPPSEGCCGASCGANCGPRKTFFHRHLRV